MKERDVRVFGERDINDVYSESLTDFDILAGQMPGGLDKTAHRIAHEWLVRANTTGAA